MLQARSLYFAVGDNELVDGPEGAAIFALILAINVGTLFAFACVVLVHSWGSLVQGWRRLLASAASAASAAGRRRDTRPARVVSCCLAACAPAGQGWRRCTWWGRTEKGC